MEMDPRCEGCPRYLKAIDRLAENEEMMGISPAARDLDIFECVPSWPDGSLTAGVTVQRGYKENPATNPRDQSLLTVLSIGTPRDNCPLRTLVCK